MSHDPPRRQTARAPATATATRALRAPARATRRGQWPLAPGRWRPAAGTEARERGSPPPATRACRCRPEAERAARGGAGERPSASGRARSRAEAGAMYVARRYVRHDHSPALRPRREIESDRACTAAVRIIDACRRPVRRAI